MLNHRKSNRNSIISPSLHKFLLEIVSHLELYALSVGGETQHNTIKKIKKKKPTLTQLLLLFLKSFLEVLFI